MKLLNLGCGGHRPQGPEWWNLDELRKHLKPGTPERANLDAEPRYIECSLTVDNIPMDPQSLDGILCQHVLEHMCCHDAVATIKECHTLLKNKGWLVVSVPDADYFLQNLYRDTRDNAERIFGEPISPDEPWHQSFFDYALFHREHRQVLTDPALRCLLHAGGFKTIDTFRHSTCSDVPEPVVQALNSQLNRLRFSCILFARKVVENG